MTLILNSDPTRQYVNKSKMNKQLKCKKEILKLEI